MTTGQAVRIDRVTLVVSDLDRAEGEYVATFGCSVEHRGDIEPALTFVLASFDVCVACWPPADALLSVPPVSTPSRARSWPRAMFSATESRGTRALSW